MTTMVDGLRSGAADTRHLKRPATTYVAALIVALVLQGWVMIVLGALAGDRDAHGVTIMAIGGALIFGALLVPIAVIIAVDRMHRPALSGPPIHPHSDLASLEAAVHNRFGQTDERIDDRIDALHDELRERAEALDSLVATLEGGSQGVAIAAGNVRARLRRPVA